MIRLAARHHYMTNDNGIRLQIINHWPPVSQVSAIWGEACRRDDEVISGILRHLASTERTHEEAERARLRMFELAAGTVEDRDGEHHRGAPNPKSPVPWPRSSSWAPPDISQ